MWIPRHCEPASGQSRAFSLVLRWWAAAQTAASRPHKRTSGWLPRLSRRLSAEPLAATAYGGSEYDGESLTIGSEPACDYDYTEATSPDSSYDNGDCPGQWITEVRSTTSRTFTPLVAWVSPTPTLSTCPNMHLYVTVYARNAFTGNWSYAYAEEDGHRYSHFKGVWDGLGGCDFALQDGPALADISAGALHNAYRVVGRARQYASGFWWTRRVNTGVWYGPGPCK